MRKALITGITGQDGSLLTKFLLNKDYKIYGLIAGLPGRDNFDNFHKLSIDESKIEKITLENLSEINLEDIEVYNFAAQSSVGMSWNDSLTTFDVNLMRYIKLLDILKDRKVKILQASSGEMYGEVKGKITEATVFSPNNPYSISKHAAHEYGVLLRKSQNIWITNAILFNHESPLRNEKFVLRKIVNGIKDISDGKANHLELGNIDIERDWGFAEEYVEIMWKLLQMDQPLDINIATGHTMSLKTLIGYFFAYFGITDFEKYIRINPSFYRPTDIKSIQVNTDKLNKLGINPTRINQNNIAKLI